MSEVIIEHATFRQGKETKDEAPKGMARPHQPGESVFKSILPEEIDWKPFPAFHLRCAWLLLSALLQSAARTRSGSKCHAASS